MASGKIPLEHMNRGKKIMGEAVRTPGGRGAFQFPFYACAHKKENFSNPTKKKKVKRVKKKTDRPNKHSGEKGTERGRKK